MRNKLIVIALLGLLGLATISAQNNSASAPDSAVERVDANETVNSDVEMADLMRSNGKIYVVVGVLAIVLAGMLIYLATIDRKVGRLEDEFAQSKT